MHEPKLIEEWWLEPGGGDQIMDEAHLEFWKDFIENAINADFTGTKILDFGCNRGGFLRQLHKTMPFRQAVGVDLATKSIDAAKSLKGDLPIDFIATANLSSFDSDFDFAVSTSVLYLIKDVRSHADDIFKRLKVGGIYFAGFEDFASDSKFDFIQQSINQYAAINCAGNTVDDIVEAFQMAGFDVFVKRLIPPGYIPVPISANNRWYGSASNEIDYWYSHRYCFRCVKPSQLQQPLLI